MTKTKEEKDILQNLYFIGLHIVDICDKFITHRMTIGEVLGLRHIYLDFWLWRGYIGRLRKCPAFSAVAIGLLQEFSSKIIKHNDTMNRLRNMACHFDANCSMSIQIYIDSNGLPHPDQKLPSFIEIKQLFEKYVPKIQEWLK